MRTVVTRHFKNATKSPGGGSGSSLLQQSLSFALLNRSAGFAAAAGGGAEADADAAAAEVIARGSSSNNGSSNGGGGGSGGSSSSSFTSPLHTHPCADAAAAPGQQRLLPAAVPQPQSPLAPLARSLLCSFQEKEEELEQKSMEVTRLEHQLHEAEERCRELVGVGAGRMIDQSLSDKNAEQEQEQEQYAGGANEMTAAASLTSPRATKRRAAHTC